MVIDSACGTLDLSGQKSEEILASLNQVFKSLYDQYQIVQEVWVDGIRFHEKYNEYILNHLSSIRNITIKSVPEAELMRDILEELKTYLPRLIQAFDSISELFYGEMVQENWNHVAQLTEGMQWVSQSAHALRNHLERTLSHPDLLEAIIKFESDSEKLAIELESFMEFKDFTAVGDQLKYEWPNVFHPLLEQLESEVFA